MLWGTEAKYGITQFSDLTEDQFEAMYLGELPLLSDFKNIKIFDKTEYIPRKSQMRK